jgi:hypothetical protein
MGDDMRPSFALLSAFLTACNTGGSIRVPGAEGDASGSQAVEIATVLASGLRAPGAIAVRSGVVYWVEADGAIRSMPTSDGTPAVVGTGCRQTTLAVDATNAYCAGSDQNVRAIALSGGASTALAATEPALDVAVDPSRVYFTTFYGERVTGGNNISVVGAVPIDGGPVLRLATSQLLPSSVAVGGGYLYWLDAVQDDNGAHPASGVAVMRVPVDGGAAASIASTTGISPGLSGENKAIAIDLSSVYFSNEAALLKVPLAGGSPMTLATGFSLALAIDDASVYWATADSGGAIMRTPLSGGVSTTLVAGETAASVAVDASHVYWSNPQKGTIASAPK